VDSQGLRAPIPKKRVQIAKALSEVRGREDVSGSGMVCVKEGTCIKIVRASLQCSVRWKISDKRRYRRFLSARRNRLLASAASTRLLSSIPSAALGSANFRDREEGPSSSLESLFYISSSPGSFLVLMESYLILGKLKGVFRFIHVLARRILQEDVYPSKSQERNRIRTMSGKFEYLFTLIDDSSPTQFARASVSTQRDPNKG
jgi:hypothetical protein